MTRSPRLAACLLGSWLALNAADASGQDFDASRAAVRGAARFLAVQGDKKLHAGQYAEALRLFRMAEELYHAPTLVLAMAQAERRLERWAEARKHYLAVIAEKMGRNANPAFLQAQLTAREELEALEPRIPTLRLQLENDTGRAEVRIDGRARPLESLARPIYLDPGEHDVVVIDDGRVRAEKVMLTEGRRLPLTIDMRKRTGVPSMMVKPQAQAPPIGWWWGAGALGMGVMGLTAGTITGVLAIEDANAVKASCSRNGCDPALHFREERAHEFATASTVSFVVGGVLAAAGATLLVLDVTLEGEPAEVGLVANPTGLVVEGRF